MMGKLRDHAGSLGPHEILAGLLGQGPRLGLLVVHALGVVRVLVVILQDLGGDLAGAVLLT